MSSTDDIWTALERELASGAARGADQLAPHAAGGLKRAAEHLLSSGGAVAIVTGFYVAHADRPAAETDGPLAAIALTEWLRELGRKPLILTDTPCAPVVQAGLDEAQFDADALICVDLNDADTRDPTARLLEALAKRGVDTLIAVERPGRAADGRCYSMRANDLSAHTIAFDPLFHQAELTTLAIGDGGNEIGMGALPRRVIRDAVDNGETIASITPADSLLVAGVSHWGAYALAAAATLLDPAQAPLAHAVFSDARETARLQAALDAGAVDGVTARSEPTIDGFDLGVHRAKRDALFKLVTP